eukprot:CAMPEP_0202058124 /NCGR_PEP_ID=MMETSP0963-20130614/30772_1 /ASSEMBLY_ACC=CAM_ASM_000494 /TAXON_ID=4773 /ORGANISM="Schizochytrium aggregatum, Strain ATCC28209" /LENGTH=67 /DNA_ID=CAMNT_0048624065 /DNA_START=47 /DNA_END=246 /DNA_ORIENTATION=+
MLAVFALEWVFSRRRYIHGEADSPYVRGVRVPLFVALNALGSHETQTAHKRVRSRAGSEGVCDAKVA